MGFFSDLKDDLSQAVNELMPEEALEEESLEMEVEEEAMEIQPEAEEEASVEEEPAIADSKGFDADLSQMLEQVEEEVEMAVEEPVYTAPVVEEKKPEFVPSGSKRPSDEVSVLTESIIINGNIATEGSLEIRGSVVGNVEALGKLNITGAIQGHSQAAEIYAEGAKITGDLKSTGSIKIGQSCVIVGDVSATSAVVAGAVKGNIDVRGPVILDASAIVMGDIKSKSVQINSGAVIEGMCSQCYAEVNPTSFFEELKKMK